MLADNRSWGINETSKGDTWQGLMIDCVEYRSKQLRGDFQSLAEQLDGWSCHLTELANTRRKTKLYGEAYGFNTVHILHVGGMWICKWRCQLSICILMSEAQGRNLKRKCFKSSLWQSWSHGYVVHAPKQVCRVTFPEKAYRSHLSMMDTVATLSALSKPPGPAQYIFTYWINKSINRRMNKPESWSCILDLSMEVVRENHSLNSRLPLTSFHIFLNFQELT